VIAFEIARVAYDRHGASQRVDELTAAVALVIEAAPEIVVEIGCDRGGTLFCWRQICNEVYGITLADNSWPTGGQCGPLIDHGATVLFGNSRHPASRAWLLRNLGGRDVDVLHIDGDHSYEGVRADWRMYSPLVRPGGLVLIHDILNRRDPRVDVPRFWQEIERDHDTSVIASKRNPIGFGVVTMEER
jgi:cephalosporin hydroxylase